MPTPDDGGPASGPATLGRARFALGAFLAAYILSFVDRQILSLMVEPVRRDLGISDLQMGLLQGLAFAMLYAFIGIPIGLLADRVSRKRIITAGVLVWSACTALCGMAGSFAHLFLARMGVGVGEAALSPAAHSSLSDAFPPERLARAMSIYTLGITLGSGAALLIGGSVVNAIASSGDLHLPLVGQVRAWQAAFIAVSLPGLLVALLVTLTSEPPRRHRSARHRPGLGPLLAYLRRERRAFAAIYGNSTVLSIMGYGLPAWYPTLLIRRFGLSAGEAAGYLGLAYLICGSAGALAAGWMADRMAGRGRADANLRLIAIISFAGIVPATLAPLMPSPLLVMALFVPFCFLFNGYFGCSIAAIQLATPNELRGTNAALFLLANSLIGLSVGTALVPLLDRWFFGGHGQIGPSLAIVALLCSTIAGLLARSGLRQYGLAVAAVGARQ